MSLPNENGVTFRDFMKKVNKEILALTDGAVDSNDLIDYGFHDAWDACEDPRDVAIDVIQNDGTFAELIDEA